MTLPFRYLALIVAISVSSSMCAARAGCPTSVTSTALRAVFPGLGLLSSKASLTAASEAPIWRTITIGEYKGVNAVRTAFDASPCPIGLGESADEILGRPAFLYAKKRTQLDLTVVSVLDLGFGEDGATLQEIYARYDRELVDLTVGNGGAGLLLIGGDGEPGLVLAGRIRFVFVRPRIGDQSLPDGELVKR
jgi:hypothetical protein